jgi:hypothetical protein
MVTGDTAEGQLMAGYPGLQPAGAAGARIALIEEAKLLKTTRRSKCVAGAVHAGKTSVSYGTAIVKRGNLARSLTSDQLAQDARSGRRPSGG